MQMRAGLQRHAIKQTPYVRGTDSGGDGPLPLAWHPVAASNRREYLTSSPKTKKEKIERKYIPVVRRQSTSLLRWTDPLEALLVCFILFLHFVH